MITRHITTTTLYHADGSIGRKVELYGKSTDEKPTNVPNSTPFYEMDTGKVFMYDGETCSWVEQ